MYFGLIEGGKAIKPSQAVGTQTSTALATLVRWLQLSSFRTQNNTFKIMAVIYLPMANAEDSRAEFQNMRDDLLMRQSVPELWMQMELDANGLAYVRQAIISVEIDAWVVKPLFLDFYFPSRGVAIEIDGSQHRDASSRLLDQHKNNWCLNSKTRLIRIMTHIGNFGNRTEMLLWARNIANPNFQFNELQYGTGFGYGISEMYTR